MNREKILKEHIVYLQKEVLIKKKLNPNKLELIDYKNMEIFKEILYKEYRINLFDGVYKKLVIAREFENKFKLYSSDGTECKTIEKL